MNKIVCIFYLCIFLIACDNKSTLKQNESQQNLNPIKIAHDSLSCEEGVKQAYEDLENGILGHYVYGDRSTGKMYDSILMNDYNIKVFVGGCLVPNSWICYNRVMNRYILLKFKRNIFHEATLKSYILKYIKLTSKDPLKYSIIDFSNSYQKCYLLEFLKVNTNHNMNTTKIINENIKSIIAKFSSSSQISNLKILYDTSGFAIDIKSKIINVKTKNLIISELNKYGILGVCEIEGRKKKFLIERILE